MFRKLATASLIALNLTAPAAADNSQEKLHLGFNTTDECVVGTIKDIFGETADVLYYFDSFNAHEEGLWKGDEISISLSPKEEGTPVRTVLDIEFTSNGISHYLSNEDFYYDGSTVLPKMDIEAGKISEFDGSLNESAQTSKAVNTIRATRSALLNCFSMS